MALRTPVSIALVGAGRIGTHHAAAIAHDVHTAELVAVVDPRVDVASALADDLGARAVPGRRFHSIPPSIPIPRRR